jgi:hypothetical protein
MVSTEITPGRGDFDRDLVGEIVSATPPVATIDPIDMLIPASLVGVVVIGRRVGDLVGRCLVGMEVGVKLSITPIDILMSLLFIGDAVGERAMGLSVEDLIDADSAT